MRGIGDNKKGQQMTLGTIIAIVLGIAVLVFLIFGFSTGWKNMWSKVTQHTSAANVEDRIADCKNDCSLGERSAWCFEKKTLRFFNSDGKLIEVEGTCEQFLGIAEADVKNIIFKENKNQITALKFSSCSSFNCTTTAPSTQQNNVA